MTNDNLGTKLMNTFDAKVWAEEFKKLNPDCDEGLMHTWFASAIMCGYDFAWRKQEKKIKMGKPKTDKKVSKAKKKAIKKRK